MSEDNNKIGATITYDSQHALDAARKIQGTNSSSARS